MGMYFKCRIVYPMLFSLKMRGAGCVTPSFMGVVIDFHDPEFRKAQTNFKRPLARNGSHLRFDEIEIDELRQHSTTM